MAYGMT
jgi:hypothetical protein